MVFLKENKDTIKIVYSEILTNENFKTQLIDSIKITFEKINFKAILKNIEKLILKLTRTYQHPKLFVHSQDLSVPTQSKDLFFLKTFLVLLRSMIYNLLNNKFIKT